MQQMGLAKADPAVIKNGLYALAGVSATAKAGLDGEAVGWKLVTNASNVNRDGDCPGGAEDLHGGRAGGSSGAASSVGCSFEGAMTTSTSRSCS